ncbi:MAG: SIMPL domain-containing protein [Terriglobales bacterium]
MATRAQSAAIILILMLATTAHGQQQPTVTAQPNTVYVGAEGRYEAAPDTALIQFNIAAQQENSKDAYEQASKAAEQIRQVLRNNGVDPKAAEIGFYSLTPVYDWRTPKRKLVGYRVSANVSLKLKDFSKVAPIFQQLVAVEMTENQSLSYTLDDIDAAKIKAVQDAFQRAQREAGAVAHAGGRALGDLIYASVDTYEQVRPLVAPMAKARVMGAEAAPPPTEEFTPHRVTVTARVSTMFGLK